MTSSFSRNLCLCSMFFVLLCSPFWGPAPYDSAHYLSYFMTETISDGFNPTTGMLILTELRLPRLFGAALCGSCLSIAGILCQGLFRNPLADPGILGCSGGSSLCVLLLYSLGLQWKPELSVPLAAFTGAIISTVILLLISGNILKSPGFGQLLLSGMALASLWGALNSFLISLSVSRHELLQSVMKWLLGGLQALTWKQLAWSTMPCILGIVWALSLSRKLDILSLGYGVAESLGIAAAGIRIQSIACMSLLLAMVVSLAGPLPFVGLIVPHLTRMIVGPGHRQLMICGLANGASLLIFADLCARSLFMPEEAELGVLTSLIGAPFFFWILCMQRKELLC
ncbi:MAG: iron ABC transporter permease [Deltaproteobacteria bacterium]|nr:iron ABC transporter permease [Deltaproteobacteria bacterium]